MFCYRITKYNPEYRDSSGAYKKDEWTSYSDIGSTIENEALSAEEYLNIENAYVEAISLIMDEVGINSLAITALEKHNAPQKNDVLFDPILLKTYQSLKINQSLNKTVVLEVARLALRDYMWCKLESENMFVHFGYDYYMYIGSQKKPNSILPSVEALGLFVEQIDESPYSYRDEETDTDQAEDEAQVN